jgi:hypothetical protein
MKKSFIPLLIFVVLLGTGSVAYLAYAQTKKSDTKPQTNAVETVSKVVDKEPETPKQYTQNSKLSNIPISEDELSEKATIITEYLPALIGNTKGNSIILQSSFVFPITSLNILESKQVEINADGFDLGLLNNKDLEIEEGVYPQMSIIMSGVIVEKEGELTMTIDSLSPEFHTKDAKSPLNNDTSLKMLSALEKLGFDIPNVTKTNPLTLPLSVDFNSENDFSLSSTNSDTLLFNYTTIAK